MSIINESFATVATSATRVVELYYPVEQRLIDGTDRPEWFGPFISFAEKAGSPLIFGLDPVQLEAYLADRGLKLIDDVGAAEYQELYLKPLGRELNVFEGERVVFAECMGLSAA